MIAPTSAADPETGVTCPSCGEPTEFQRLTATTAHHVCPTCNTSGLLDRLRQRGMTPSERGQAAIDPWFPITGIVLLIVAIISMEVYRQIATTPPQDIEYVCNGMTGGCPGGPIVGVGPVILVIVAAAVITVVLRVKNWAGDGEDRGQLDSRGHWIFVAIVIAVTVAIILF